MVCSYYRSMSFGVAEISHSLPGYTIDQIWYAHHPISTMSTIRVWQTRMRSIRRHYGWPSEAYSHPCVAPVVISSLASYLPSSFTSEEKILYTEFPFVIRNSKSCASGIVYTADASMLDSYPWC
jgi:hypothetical protein